MEVEPKEMMFRINSGTVAKIIVIGILFWLAFYLRDIVFVIIASTIIASSIEPIIKWFIERRIPRVFAVILIYVSVALIFAATFYFLIIPLFTELQDFVGTLPKYLGTQSQIPIQKSNVLSTSPFGTIFNNLPISEILSWVNVVISSLSQGAFTAASTILGGFLSFVLIVVLSFYLSVQQDGIANLLKTLSPARHRKYIVNLWNRSEQKIGLWLQGQLLLGVIVAILVYLGLELLGIKHALLLGFLAGVFELIPLFGPILSAIPGIAIAFLGGGLTSAILVAGLYIIIQQFESQLIYPLVVKKVVGVPPIVSILALVVGAKLAGFLGLLLSVPIAAILMEFFNDLERNRVAEEQEIKK